MNEIASIPLTLGTLRECIALLNFGYVEEIGFTELLVTYMTFKTVPFRNSLFLAKIPLKRFSVVLESKAHIRQLHPRLVSLLQ